MRKIAGIVALAGIAALTPTNVGLAGAGPVVRLSELCGQATSCIEAEDYICSTFHNDHLDYDCYTGCEEET